MSRQARERCYVDVINLITLKHNLITSHHESAWDVFIAREAT